MFGEGVSLSKDFFQTIYNCDIIIISFRREVIPFTGKNTPALIQSKPWLGQLSFNKGDRFAKGNERERKQPVKQFEHLSGLRLCLYPMRI